MALFYIIANLIFSFIPDSLNLVHTDFGTYDILPPTYTNSVTLTLTHFRVRLEQPSYNILSLDEGNQS